MPNTDAAWQRAAYTLDEQDIQIARVEIMDTEPPMFVEKNGYLICKGLKKEVVKQKKWGKKSSKGGIAGAKSRNEKRLRANQTSTKRQPTPQPKAYTPTPSPILFPSLKDTPLTPLWVEFVQHRIDMKKPLTDRAAKMLLTRLDEMGAGRAVAALKWSMENGWQGVFEPDEQQSPTVAGQRPAKPTTMYTLTQKRDALKEKINSMSATYSLDQAWGREKNPQEFRVVKGLRDEVKAVVAKIGGFGV